MSNSTRTVRIRFFEDNEFMLQHLIDETGLTATGLIHKLIRNAYEGKEDVNEFRKRN